MAVTPHPDFATFVESVDMPMARDGQAYSAHDVALTIRESRANGVDADVYRDASGPYLELHDSRGRSYGRYRYEA